MFDEIFGLPAHPLMVHAPVVLIPITVAVAVAYALVPPLRNRLGWVLALAAPAGAGSAWGAAQSGGKMAESLQQSDQLTAHAQFGDLLWKYAALLAVVAVVLVAVDWSRRNRSADDRTDDDGYSHRRAPSSGGMMMGVVSIVLTLGLLAAAGVSGYYAVKTGHSGATMVWAR